MHNNEEETGKWVVIHHTPYESNTVYGFFETEEEAMLYGEDQGFALYGGVFQVAMVLNANVEHEDPNDYVGMGWVDSHGRP